MLVPCRSRNRQQCRNAAAPVLQTGHRHRPAGKLQVRHQAQQSCLGQAAGLLALWSFAASARTCPPGRVLLTCRRRCSTAQADTITQSGHSGRHAKRCSPLLAGAANAAPCKRLSCMLGRADHKHVAPGLTCSHVGWSVGHGSARSRAQGRARRSVAAHLAAPWHPPPAALAAPPAPHTLSPARCVCRGWPSNPGTACPPNGPAARRGAGAHLRQAQQRQ